jgi:hypothetical protein
MHGLLRRASIASAVGLGWLLYSVAPALATTYTVTNINDAGPGSLRAAIGNANGDPGQPAGIVFAPGVTGTIDLLSPLAVTRSATIDGPGASTLELDGNGGQVQILSVASSSIVSITGIEFAFGGASSYGGAITNAGTLTLSNDVFAHNRAGDPGSTTSEGGAIASSGTLTVTDSTFVDNAAGGAGATGDLTGAGLGGAIYNAPAGSLTVTSSTFTGNSAGGAGGSGTASGEGAGGAIASGANSAVTVTNSTFTANVAGGSSGGAPFSGDGEGGALATGPGATATLLSDTIDTNTVGSAPGGLGAGIANEGAMSIAATIVAGNTGGTGNCSNQGTLSAHASLEGPAGQTSCGFDLPSADPGLGALTVNGGPTDTQALVAGSPVIGAVTDKAYCPATDQRGAKRPTGGCDVGAYENAPPAADGSTASGVGRTAATLAGVVSNPDVRPGTVWFQYGTSTAYDNSTAAQALAPNSFATPYGAPLAGLAPGTTYHFRLVAQDPDGTLYGPDQQFTTAQASSPVAPSWSPSNESTEFGVGKAIVHSNGELVLLVRTPGAGHVAARATFVLRKTVITHKGAKRLIKHVTRTFTYGTATTDRTGAGTFKFVIGLSARAANELKLLGSRQVRIAVTFTPTGGSARLQTKTVTVNRNRKGKYS